MFLKRTCRLLLFCAASAILLAFPSYIEKIEANEKQAFLTDEERSWLAAHPVIRLAPDPDFPPTEYFTEDGQYKGIAADFVGLVEKKLGIEFKIERLKNWDEVIAKAKTREIDMFGAATRTPERSQYMLFTEPYIKLPVVIIVRKQVEGSLTLDNLNDMKVAVISGYMDQEMLTSINPGIKQNVVKDAVTGLRKTSLGVVDAMVSNEAVSTYYLQKEGITNLRIAGDTGFSHDLGFAVRKDWPELIGILDKALKQINPDERQAVIGKWISLGRENIFASREFWIGITLILTCMGLLFSIILIWNRSLQTQVDNRTHQLEKELEERNRLDKELRENRRKLTTLMSNLQGMVYRCLNDRDWTMEFVSEGCRNLTGYEPSDILYNKKAAYNDLIVPEDADMVWEKVQEGVSRKRPFEMTYRIRTANDDVKWVWEQGVGVFSESGELVALEGFINDVTQRVKMDEALRKLNEELDLRVMQRTAQLEAANKELEAFAYSVSHDLRAPLRAIDGFSQALTEDYSDILDEMGLDFLNRVRAGSQRMGQMIDDILRLSRLTRGDMTFEEVNLSEIVQSIADDLSNGDSGRNVVFKISENLHTMGDPHLIRVALENLLGNAWKFSANNEEAHIEFGTKMENSNTVFYVKDDGAGFDMAYADKLFGAFQRLHGVNEFPGTGIGLATVQRVIHRHGGKIWAQAEVGGGATFFFTLNAKQKSDD